MQAIEHFIKIMNFFSFSLSNFILFIISTFMYSFIVKQTNFLVFFIHSNYYSSNSQAVRHFGHFLCFCKCFFAHHLSIAVPQLNFGQTNGYRRSDQILKCRIVLAKQNINKYFLPWYKFACTNDIPKHDQETCFAIFHQIHRLYVDPKIRLHHPK